MSKYRLLWLTLIWLGVQTGMAESPDYIARIHFAGSTAIASDPEFRVFENFFCSTNALALERQTLDKLGHYPRAWIGTRASARVLDGYPQIRPLLDDFVQAEWYLEAKDSAGIAPEFALAIHLSNERAKFWERDVANLLVSWTGLPTQSLSGGWSLKKHDAPDSIRFLYLDGWVVLSCEQGKFTMGDELVRQIKATHRPLAAPTNYWLSVDADWSRLARYFPGLQALDLPRTSVRLVGKGGDICWDGKLDFAEALPSYGNWQIPTSLIHQPLMSFTAARGINHWLQEQRWAQKYLITPTPSQLFTWSLSGMPFMSYAAAPVENEHNALLELDQALASHHNPSPNPANPFAFAPRVVLANEMITFQGVPFATPFIQGKHEPNGDFIFGGFFPYSQFPKSMPEELVNRLAGKNVVFCHWEMTGERLKSLPQIAQLMLLLSQHRQLGEDSLASKWLHQVGPALGNSITTGIQTGSNEVSFTRKAPGGLTAVELFAFACWLEAPDFPGCDLKMPPVNRVRRTLPQQPVRKPSMPLLIH